MENVITLNLAAINTWAEVMDIKASGELRRRFLDLGIILGTKIKVLYRSSFGDPTAYLIRGSVMAIREDEAKFIKIKSINEGRGE